MASRGCRTTTRAGSRRAGIGGAPAAEALATALAAFAKHATER